MFVCKKCNFSSRLITVYPVVCRCGSITYENGEIKMANPRGYGIPVQSGDRPERKPPEKPKDLPEEVSKFFEGNLEQEEKKDESR